MSLPFSLLNHGEGDKLLAMIEEKLYTPLGLRSLSPEDPAFQPVYKGDQWHRDNAYHQGTVWSYLIGEYFLTVLKIKGNTPQSKQDILSRMNGLKDHFYHADCLHAISEIFDGADPGPGRGCVQQAWSVGMLLLVLDKINQ